MLKLPTEARGPRPKTARSQRAGHFEQARSRAQLEAIGDAIERSVTDTLSGQILAILDGGESQPADDRNGADAGVVTTSAQPSALQAMHENAEFNETIARARLSKRQMEVLRLLGKGKTNREIADALFRSPHTIKLHVSAILKQLNLKSRTQAAHLASKL